MWQLPRQGIVNYCLKANLMRKWARFMLTCVVSDTLGSIDWLYPLLMNHPLLSSAYSHTFLVQDALSFMDLQRTFLWIQQHGCANQRVTCQSISQKVSCDNIRYVDGWMDYQIAGFNARMVNHRFYQVGHILRWLPVVVVATCYLHLKSLIAQRIWPLSFKMKWKQGKTRSKSAMIRNPIHQRSQRSNNHDIYSLFKNMNILLCIEA